MEGSSMSLGVFGIHEVYYTCLFGSLLLLHIWRLPEASQGSFPPVHPAPPCCSLNSFVGVNIYGHDL